MLNLISHLKKSGLKKILLPVDPTIRRDIAMQRHSSIFSSIVNKAVSTRIFVKNILLLDRYSFGIRNISNLKKFFVANSLFCECDD